MGELGFSASNFRDFNSVDGGRRSPARSGSPPASYGDARMTCVCGAKEAVERMRRDLERRDRQLSRDRQSLRLRMEELATRERRESECAKELQAQEEDLETYKSYLQSRQNAISSWYQKYQVAHTELRERMAECAKLERECKTRLAEYENALSDVSRREHAIAEGMHALESKSLEVQRLEKRLLEQSERVLALQEQQALTRSRLESDIREHKRRMTREMDELQKLQQKATDQQYLAKHMQSKIEQVQEALNFNTELTRELQRRQDACASREASLERRRQKLVDMVQQVEQSSRQLEELKNKIKADARNIDASANLVLGSMQQPSVLSMSTNQALQLELAAKENELKLRQESLQRLEQQLEKERKSLDEKAKRMQNTSEEFNRLESQIAAHKEQQALLELERNSLAGQRAQFETYKAAKEQELEATRNRLTRWERQLQAREKRLLQQQKAHSQQQKIESLRSAKTLTQAVVNEPISLG